ncbi:cyclin domain-containing protein [Sphaeroforma arctica JP610]|uniref:Cyclin domain-containing protein n=1 Tax=Sphaeroforma arctica JP610 TaxID=667725 RepID=A0A0L0FL87_9EUKA|nr:cyclin domain-containing protein [Sphaeroforma arctica JP610]KNC77525.1 cyclin domain-containing protein [Sphaeroforma arctica JP610]|eukprot:XP_014151427.1 cyclin domain-containing protein [Sphaeroforma arctica JP610]
MTANFYTSSHSNYWLLDEHELELTKHELGTNDITEKDLVVMQIFLADMALNLGKRMQMKQRVIATAIVYMRRFFAKNSYQACHPLLMVPTVLYLANKVEECGNTNLKTVIGHMVKMALEDYQYLYGDQRVVTVEPKHIVECEFYLLEGVWKEF